MPQRPILRRRGTTCIPERGGTSEPLGPRLTTERSWQGLHSLLSFGRWQPFPLLRGSLSGGTPIGEPLCYGAILYLTAAEVRSISQALDGVSQTALRDSFDPAALEAAGLPPRGGWRVDDFPYLWDTFLEVRDFFRGAANAGQALLLWIG